MFNTTAVLIKFSALLCRLEFIQFSTLSLPPAIETPHRLIFHYVLEYNFRLSPRLNETANTVELTSMIYFKVERRRAFIQSSDSISGSTLRIIFKSISLVSDSICNEISLLDVIQFVDGLFASAVDENVQLFL